MPTKSFPESNRIKAAVITGGHFFDVPGFHAVFRSMTDVDFYPQTLGDFVADAGKVREHYDGLVFFNMHIPMPDERTRGLSYCITRFWITPSGICGRTSWGSKTARSGTSCTTCPCR